MYHENSRKTFTAAAAVGPDALVRLTAAGVEPCDAGELPIGGTETGAAQAGDCIGVRLMNTPGTVEVTCGVAVTTGVLLTTGAAGAVALHTEGTPIVGVALNNGVAGSVVEAMPLLLPATSTPSA